MKTAFTPLFINISGIAPLSTSLWMYNCKVTIDEPLGWAVKELIVRNNDIRYLDVDIVCPVYKLTSLFHLDLSDNGLEMVHPTVCLPNLEKYVLSNNKMFRMQEKSRNLFGKLFVSHSKLREINLSNNRLLEIPKKMFKHNKLLKRIDLSFNQLQQLQFDLMELYHLRTLDVSNNNIKVLDEISINSLDGLPSLGPHIHVNNRCLVKMKSNPFLCSTCACKSSIQWLVSLTKLNIEQLDLVCKTEDKTFRNIDESVTKRIQNICNRKIIIIISTVCTSVTLMAVCIIGIILHRRKRRLKRQRNMENVLARLIEGEGQYEFVAFLSHSSNDYQFVQDHVINQLNENLKLIIGTDRDLICTGDKNYRPGFTVHDETERCLNRASVVILLVSDNFCRSQYCLNEFDKAYLLGKPVVLMLFGNVDEEIMMPTLHGLYKRDARILWKIENGQFVLNTTWENICTSLLEKVPA
ncbi:toll-like receptor 4 [Ruditapes philippinarum]|uniref:toll-like receptor 4 n=1 Tax=Ruditapes philippinarum TaxID=129788 RepID=UPI00295BA7D9|nr:toll-like receptor 4 [Ruditapes philippinarum]